MVTEKMIEAAKLFDDMSPEESIGAFGGSGQWVELCTVRDLRKLEAALSTDAEPVAELQSVDAKELDEAIQLLPSVMRPSLSKVIIAAIEEQRRVITYFKRTSRARQLAFEAATAPAPPAPSVAVKDLEWVGHGDKGANADTGLGTRYEIRSIGADLFLYRVVQNCVEGHETRPNIIEAKKAAQAHHDAAVRAALSAQVQDVVGLERLKDITYAVQHSPNCPAKFLVRLVGKSGVIDLKPYGGPFTFMKNETTDILGFGKTIDEAIDKALAAAAPAAKLGEKP
ncbi:hypothetical protein RMR10_004395 [Agrobacterium rosae]|uniref:hypothetical protein n=1 Tax=Agrobacterium rosae TaxID=1972867 RepID=UPI002A16BD04|nr:hypothetical protein [Agrobacterium rosae]MDX8315639.1 hypothetical protein [Agrobacterium rosae]